jgi:hypothetical protein
MAEGRRREAWEHTASMMALHANINRTKKSRTFEPKDFFPKILLGENEKDDRIMTSDINVLKIFLEKSDGRITLKR